MVPQTNSLERRTNPFPFLFDKITSFSISSPIHSLLIIGGDTFQTHTGKKNKKNEKVTKPLHNKIIISPSTKETRFKIIFDKVYNQLFLINTYKYIDPSGRIWLPTDQTMREKIEKDDIVPFKSGLGKAPIFIIEDEWSVMFQLCMA